MNRIKYTQKTGRRLKKNYKTTQREMYKYYFMEISRYKFKIYTLTEQLVFTKK